MDIDVAVIGTGKVGRTVGEAVRDARYRWHTPEESVREAVDEAEAVFVGVPGRTVADFARDHADEMAGKIIDAASEFVGDPAHRATRLDGMGLDNGS
jgi:8-hydroxy-5-deazaflavin:NADPH oxidoreductase